MHEAHKATPREQRERWIRTWPDYCRKCSASGLVGGFVGGHWDPPEAPDPCPDCISAGKCPRCAAEYALPESDVNRDAMIETVLESETWTCRNCGWTVASPDTVPFDDVPTDLVERPAWIPDSWIQVGTLPGSKIPVFDMPRLKETPRVEGSAAEFDDGNYDFAADDLAFDAAREAGNFRGRIGP